MKCEMISDCIISPFKINVFCSTIFIDLIFIRMWQRRRGNYLIYWLGIIRRKQSKKTCGGLKTISIAHHHRIQERVRNGDDEREEAILEGKFVWNWFFYRWTWMWRKNERRARVTTTTTSLTIWIKKEGWTVQWNINICTI